MLAVRSTGIAAVTTEPECFVAVDAFSVEDLNDELVRVEYLF